MPNNPYAAAASRIFGIVLYSIGCLVCLGSVVRSLRCGAALAFDRGIPSAGTSYTAAANPSQFWFGIVAYALVGMALGWLAWRTYRS